MLSYATPQQTFSTNGQANIYYVKVQCSSGDAAAFIQPAWVCQPHFKGVLRWCADHFVGISKLTIQNSSDILSQPLQCLSMYVMDAVMFFFLFKWQLYLHIAVPAKVEISLPNGMHRHALRSISLKGALLLSRTTPFLDTLLRDTCIITNEPLYVYSHSHIIPRNAKVKLFVFFLIEV